MSLSPSPAREAGNQGKGIGGAAGGEGGSFIGPASGVFDVPEIGEQEAAKFGGGIAVHNLVAV